MKKIILVTLAILPAGVASAQNTKPSPNSLTPVVSNSTPATASDVEALRQQVQSLTETVKTLQQQVKDQQAALEKANLTGESSLLPLPALKTRLRQPEAHRHGFQLRTHRLFHRQLPLP